MLLPLKQGLKHRLNGFPERPTTRCYATSIKTRIETRCVPVNTSEFPVVVMLLPLKQGLKHQRRPLRPLATPRCYATSIKTRIETVGFDFPEIVR